MTSVVAVPQWPAEARIGATVPKRRLAHGSSAPTELRNTLTSDVKSVTWEATLSPETVNLPAGAEVPEFVVLSVELRVSELSDRVLDLIDRAIPHLVVFELHRRGAGGGELQLAAFVGHRAVGSSRRLVRSPWQEVAAPRADLPSAVDLEDLYLRVLRPMLPVTVGSGARVSVVAGRISQVSTLERLIERERRIEQGTGQFNRRAEARQRRRALEAERAALIAGQDHEGTPWTV